MIQIISVIFGTLHKKLSTVDLEHTRTMPFSFVAFARTRGDRMGCSREKAEYWTLCVQLDHSK
jgi:hypothetical protein